MKSGLPKVLHTAAGRPLLAHVLAALEPLDIEGRYAVISSKVELFERVLAEARLRDPVEFIVQDPPRGTADAVKTALGAIGDRHETILVLQGDSPLIDTSTIDALLHVHFDNDASATSSHGSHIGPDRIRPHRQVHRWKGRADRRGARRDLRGTRDRRDKRRYLFVRRGRLARGTHPGRGLERTGTSTI